MSKVKLHPMDDERVIVELTGQEVRKLFYIMSKAESRHLPPAMLALRDKLDIILDHVKIPENPID